MPKLAMKYQRRLDRLRRLLLADARAKKGVQFNIDVVAKTTAPTPEEIVACGTQACAMGLAAISGAFASEGLGYIWIAPYSWNDRTPRQLAIKMNGRRVYYDTAARRLFGLSRPTAGWLFDPMSYRRFAHRGAGAAGERQVARRIAFVIQHGQRAPA